MRLDAAISGLVQSSSEYLFLPAEAGLQLPDNVLSFERAAMVELAAETLSLMGLSTVIRPGGESPDDVVPKPHDKVVNREAAVAEQFHHPDVAMVGFAGIFLVGLEGKDPDEVPPTAVIDNAAMVEHVHEFVAGGVLQDRLEDIRVVRPFFDPHNRKEWMDLPRHSLERLGSQFEALLTPAQAEHVAKERAKVTDTSKYIDEVSVSDLQSRSIIDDSLLLTCGVAQRELRLAFDGEQSPEETRALKQLHDEITRYLLNRDSPEKEVRVTKGSAIFVPINQLHRATPYEPFHRRSVVGVRCYAMPDQTPPAAWRQASGTDY
jgi:hypothetical protein